MQIHQHTFEPAEAVWALKFHQCQPELVEALKKQGAVFGTVVVTILGESRRVVCIQYLGFIRSYYWMSGITGKHASGVRRWPCMICTEKNRCWSDRIESVGYLSKSTKPSVKHSGRTAWDMEFPPLEESESGEQG